jgi:PTH1 family peptidyl-tRNA hydrolase
MKYLVVGLGNTGAEYEHTRHNIGFDIVDFTVKTLDGSFRLETLGHVAETKYKGRTIYFLKPNTFMNLSGKAVHYWMQKLHIPLEHVMIVVDDMHLDLGKLRLRDKGSDGGHNGLKDIEQKLGHAQYIRLRAGIGKDFFPGQQVAFVLGKWKQEEMEAMEKMKQKASEAIKTFVFAGLKPAMDHLNR